jgi:hypothetical protein
MPASRIYNPFVNGLGGGGSSPDAEEIQTVSFSYLESQVSVLNIPAGARVLQVSVSFSTAFNDNSASVMVGDSGLNNRLMQSSQNDPTTLGVYQAHNEYQYVSATQVNVYINSGSSTQGIGLVAVIYNLNN